MRRRSEGVAARTMLEVDRQIVQDMYRRRNEQLVEAKTSYFTKKVEESKDNPKALFRLTRNMMGNTVEKQSFRCIPVREIWRMISVPCFTTKY